MTDAALRPAAVSPGALVAPALGIVFGLFLLWGVAFAGPDVIHNAAHDTRHSVAFPCH